MGRVGRPGSGTGGGGGPAPNTILPTTVAADYAADDITLLIPRITADVPAFGWKIPEVTDQVTAGGQSAVVTFVEQLAGSPYTALTLVEPLGVAIEAGEPARVDRIVYAEVERDTIDGALTAHGSPTQGSATIRSADGNSSFTFTVISRNGSYLGLDSNDLRVILRFGHGARGFSHTPGAFTWTASYATGKPTLSELRNGFLQYWAEFFSVSAIQGNGNSEVEGNDFQHWQTAGGTAATAGATSLTFDNVLEPIDVGDILWFADTTNNAGLGDPKRRVVSAVDHSGAGSVISWVNDLEFAYADGSEVLVIRSRGYAQAVAVLRGEKGDMGDVGQLATVTVARADSAGVVEGTPSTFPLLEDAAVAGIVLTTTAGFIKITMPTGTELGSVIDSVDGEVSFTRDGATQDWLSDEEYDDSGHFLLIITA